MRPLSCTRLSIGTKHDIFSVGQYWSTGNWYNRYQREGERERERERWTARVTLLRGESESEEAGNSNCGESQ
jgi:hypothetical protein